MKRKIFMILITLCFIFIPLVVSAEEIPSFGIHDNNLDVLTTNSNIQLGIYGEPTDKLQWEVHDKNICIVDQNGLVTPKSDGACIIFASDGKHTQIESFVVNVFGTLQKEVDDCLIGIPNEINLDVIKEIEVLNDEHFGEGYEYSIDYLYGYLYENYSSKLGYNTSIDFNLIEGTNKIKLKSSKYFAWEDPNNYKFIGQVNSTNEKEVTVNYATGNEKDKQDAIKTAYKTKDVYNVYINKLITEQSGFSDNILFKNAELQKEIGKDIELKFDARAGDDTPGQAAALGYVSFGKNGVFYVAKNIEFYQVLKTPHLKGDKVKALKEYIDKNLLKNNQESKVEETEYDRDGEMVYKITISEKENNNLISMLLSPFVMKVRADDSNVIYTTIEEDANTTTTTTIVPPKTGDEGLLYISLLAISSVGVVILSKKARLN